MLENVLNNDRVGIVRIELRVRSASGQGKELAMLRKLVRVLRRGEGMSS
jgi:hypothetical protein